MFKNKSISKMIFGVINKHILLAVLLMVGIIGGYHFTYALPLDGVSIAPSTVVPSFNESNGTFDGSFSINVTGNGDEMTCVSLSDTINLGGSSNVRLYRTTNASNYGNSYCKLGSFSVEVSFSTPYTNARAGEYSSSIGSSRGSLVGSDTVSIVVPATEFQNLGSVIATNPHDETLSGQGGYVYYFTKPMTGELLEGWFNVLWRSSLVYKGTSADESGDEGVIWVAGKPSSVKVGNFIEGKRITSVDYGKGATCLINKWNNETTCDNPSIWVTKINTDTSSGGKISFKFGQPYNVQKLEVITPTVKDFSISVGNVEVAKSALPQNVSFPVTIVPVSGVSCRDVSLSALSDSPFVQNVQVVSGGTCAALIKATVSNTYTEIVKGGGINPYNVIHTLDDNYDSLLSVSVVGAVGNLQKTGTGKVIFKEPVQQPIITISPDQSSISFDKNTNEVKFPVTIIAVNTTASIKNPDTNIDKYVSPVYELPTDKSPQVTSGNTITYNRILKTTLLSRPISSGASGSIILNATGVGGNASDTKTIDVTVDPSNLSATLNVTPATTTGMVSALVTAVGGRAPYTYSVKFCSTCTALTKNTSDTSIIKSYIYTQTSVTQNPTITATITDADGKTASASQQITVVPQGAVVPLSAKVQVTPASGIGPLKVNAAVSASGGSSSYISYSINFGDGSDSVFGSSNEHTYRAVSVATSYTIKATVVDSANKATSTTAQVTVLPAPLSALSVSLSVTPASTVGPVSATLTATGGRTPYSFIIDFGDGYSAFEVNSSKTSFTTPHAYSQKSDAQNITVIGGVIDADGNTVGIPKQITVTPKVSASLSVTPTNLICSGTIKASISAKDFTPTDYLINFGDGTKTVPLSASTQSHTYTNYSNVTQSYLLGGAAYSTIDPTKSALTNLVSVSVSPCPVSGLSISPLSDSISLVKPTTTVVITKTFTLTPTGSVTITAPAVPVSGMPSGITESHTFASAPVSNNVKYGKSDLVFTITPSVSVGSWTVPIFASGVDKDSKPYTAGASLLITISPQQSTTTTSTPPIVVPPPTVSLGLSPTSGISPLSVNAGITTHNFDPALLASTIYGFIFNDGSDPVIQIGNNANSHVYSAVNATTTYKVIGMAVNSKQNGLDIGSVTVYPSPIIPGIPVIPNGPVTSTTPIIPVTPVPVDLCVTNHITCDSYCTGFTNHTGGSCAPSTGQCSYSSSQSFSTSCGYVPVSCSISATKFSGTGSPMGLAPLRPVFTVSSSGGTGSYSVTLDADADGTADDSGSGATFSSSEYIFTTAGTFVSRATTQDSNNPSSSASCSLSSSNSVQVLSGTGGETNP